MENKHKRNIKIAIIVFDVILLIVALAIFTYKSDPSNFLYPIKKAVIEHNTSKQSTHVERARIYVAEAEKIQHFLFVEYKKDPKKPSIKKITSELSYFEKKAIDELAAAKKKSEGKIKDVVEKLCDTLILQYENLKLAVAQQKAGTPPDLQRLISDTKTALAESHGW